MSWKFGGGVDGGRGGRVSSKGKVNRSAAAAAGGTLNLPNSPFFVANNQPLARAHGVICLQNTEVKWDWGWPDADVAGNRERASGTSASEQATQLAGRGDPATQTKPHNCQFSPKIGTKIVQIQLGLGNENLPGPDSATRTVAGRPRYRQVGSLTLGLFQLTSGGRPIVRAEEDSNGYKFSLRIVTAPLCTVFPPV